jgi:hypothetical protein
MKPGGAFDYVSRDPSQRATIAVPMVTKSSSDMRSGAVLPGWKLRICLYVCTTLVGNQALAAGGEGDGVPVRHFVLRRFVLKGVVRADGM